MIRTSPVELHRVVIVEGRAFGGEAEVAERVGALEGGSGVGVEGFEGGGDGFGGFFGRGGHGGDHCEIVGCASLCVQCYVYAVNG